MWKATFNVPEEESIDDKMASKCVAQVHEDSGVRVRPLQVACKGFLQRWRRL